MTDKTALQKEMLLRGAPSYVNALVALETFEQGVEDMCRKVYSHHKDKLLAAMGLDDGSNWERSKDGDLAGRYAVVGIYRGTQKSGVKGPRFHVYLWFGDSEDDTGRIDATVWLDFPSKESRDEVYDQIRRKNPHCGIEQNDEDQYYALVLEIPFKLNDLASAPDETWDRLLSEWIGLCESIGGLKMSGR